MLESIKAFFKRCDKYDITLDSNRIQIGQKVEYVGYIVSNEGWKPFNDRIQSIKNFPVPKCSTDVKSFNGLARQLGSFIPDLAKNMNILTPLMSPKNGFFWTDGIFWS